MISAVAEMYGIHPQTLRLYEREGLLKPSRTEGNTRLYTDEDLLRLEFILSLARDCDHLADAGADGGDATADSGFREVHSAGGAGAGDGGGGPIQGRDCPPAETTGTTRSCRAFAQKVNLRRSRISCLRKTSACKRKCRHPAGSGAGATPA
jgi:hypothetical protein